MTISALRYHGVTVALALGAALVAFGCAGGDDADGRVVVESPSPPRLPTWTFNESMVFPADRSLMRAEDGVALPDGRLLVVDQAHGLRLVETDGSSAPFGDLRGAGYRHEAPPHDGGANGIALEPGGTHALVADIHHGGIFRVDVTTGESELVYQHGYGVNTAVRDSTGAIWFTQSAKNTPEEGGGRMWAAVDRALEEGALYRLPLQDGRPAGEPELLLDALVFGNGIAIDEAAGHLYVAETMAARVLRFNVDLDAGQLSGRTVVLDGVLPDNLELDGDGQLWVAAPLTNEVVVLDTTSGEPVLELLTPEVWAPLPGFVTGVIVGAADGAVYLTGLGNALIRLDRSRSRTEAMTRSRLTDFATRYAAAWSSQDPQKLASFCAEDGSISVNRGVPAVGRTAIAEKASGFMAAFPDMIVRLESATLEGSGRAVFRWHWTGTNAGPGGTGRAVDLRGHEQWTFNDAGLIQQSLGSYDEAEYQRQVNADSEVKG
jgi:sugar lactone lactonase YvrE